MTTMINTQILAHNHISVDCVVVGFDGEQLKVLIIKRIIDDLEGASEMKLPGSLIYMDEDLDDAAHRVLFELTGIKNINLTQFKTFGSKDRTQNHKDIQWLERANQLKIDRIVTIAYVTVVKIDKTLNALSKDLCNSWIAVDEVGELAFDHNIIIKEAISYIKHRVFLDPAYLFDLLPRKFTAAQLRKLFEVVQGKVYDIKNFHKKIAQMSYIILSDEKESGVAHRAAYYYKFDRKIYNKSRK